MIITSKSNPKIKLARGLSETRARRESGLALVEGLRNVSAAAETDTVFDALLYDPEKIPPPTIRKITDAITTGDPDITPVSSEVFASISRQNNPTGLAAIIRQKWLRLDSLRLTAGTYGLALYNIRDPGNLGTIIRTSEAVSSEAIILIDTSTDPYHPTALRAAAGSLFFQRLARTTFAGFVDWTHEQGLKVVGASQDSVDDYRAFDYPDPAILLMGNERSGLPHNYQEACDATVKIPMSGRTESLNVSIAASLLLYELFDRRRAREAGSAP